MPDAVSRLAGGFSIAAVVSGTGSVPLVVAALALAGLGNGAAMSLGSDLIISTSPSERVYRAALSRSVPGEVPGDALAAANDSVAGGLGAADHLPDPLGAQLLDGVRDAFTQALQAGLWLGATAMAVIAVTVLVVLGRNRQPDVVR